MRTKNRSGRKAGGDVLKAIEPAGSALANAQKLAYGQSANDPAAEMVRTWRSMELAAERLAQQEKHLGPKRLKEDRRVLAAWLRDEQRRFTTAASFALRLHKADWFRRVAAAIDETFVEGGQDKYPLQATALILLGTLKPVSPEARHTIRQACEILEQNGHRPSAMTDEVWSHTVRRACREAQVKLKPSKSGPIAAEN